jgi:hypothetical protein
MMRATRLTAGFSGFAKIQELARFAVDAATGRIGCADQLEQSLVFYCSIRQRLT